MFALVFFEYGNLGDRKKKVLLIKRRLLPISRNVFCAVTAINVFLMRFPILLDKKLGVAIETT